jgi:hypothetical protein
MCIGLIFYTVLFHQAHGSVVDAMNWNLTEIKVSKGDLVNLSIHTYEVKGIYRRVCAKTANRRLSYNPLPSE